MCEKIFLRKVRTICAVITAWQTPLHVVTSGSGPVSNTTQTQFYLRATHQINRRSMPMVHSLRHMLLSITVLLPIYLRQTSRWLYKCPCPTQRKLQCNLAVQITILILLFRSPFHGELLPPDGYFYNSTGTLTHKSQAFAYNPASGVIHPTWAEDLTTILLIYRT